MQQREVEIVNTLGLNATASAKLAQLAAKYQCDVSIARNGRKVNAKSLMGVMMLAAGKGSRVVLETDGPDEREALDAIVALIADGSWRWAMTRQVDDTGAFGGAPRAPGSDDNERSR
jgi:phosphocarrier protein